MDLQHILEYVILYNLNHHIYIIQKATFGLKWTIESNDEFCSIQHKGLRSLELIVYVSTKF